MNKCLAVLLRLWLLCELRAEGPNPVTSWKARMPETNRCWLGSGAVTSLLASTLRCVQHRGIYSGHPGVPLGPQLLAAACLEWEGHNLWTSVVP